MNILMSLHKIWANKILDSQKKLEFRNNIGKEFKVGSKIYIYETAKNNGSQKVIGECRIKNITHFERTNLGCYPLLGYYCENIIKDKEATSAVKKMYEIDVPNYKDGIKCSYIFQSEILMDFENKSLHDLINMSRKDREEYYKLRDKSDKLVKECDDWLYSIGFYNEDGESFYKNYIEVDNPIKYKEGRELSSFIGQNNSPIKRAPQSWCYCQNND